MSKIEVNAVEPQCGNTLTLGASGDTVTIPSGATISNLGTAAGFGSTGEVSWDTTKKTASFTGVSGVGYFVDTTSSAITVTLPASPSAGNVVAVNDYAGNFGTNAVTIGRNSSNINGSASDFIISRNLVSAQFIYVDATQGWKVVFTGDVTGDGLEEKFVTATGGSITTCGNCKIHTFTGPGTFTVQQVADCSSNNVISYAVVAGGGGGSGSNSAGGGAGGFREYKSPVTPYTASPLDGNPGGTEITVTAQAYPITVGGGGSGRGNPSPTADNGTNSVFSTVTSTGGGGGGASDNPPAKNGAPGGSGGGGGSFSTGNPGTGGSGNTPPVSPPQGNNGGNGAGQCGVARSGGGGGGATAAGGNATFPTGGPGGAGAGTLINPATGESGPGPSQYYAGGGGSGCSPSPGGVGGGGPKGTNGTANTGGGGGANQANGGSGIVIIRYKFQ